MIMKGENKESERKGKKLFKRKKKRKNKSKEIWKIKSVQERKKMDEKENWRKEMRKREVIEC